MATCQITMTQRVVANNIVSNCLAKGRNANSSSKQESKVEQEIITVSQNKLYQSVLWKDDIE